MPAFKYQAPVNAGAINIPAFVNGNDLWRADANILLGVSVFGTDAPEIGIANLFVAPVIYGQSNPVLGVGSILAGINILGGSDGTISKMGLGSLALLPFENIVIDGNSEIVRLCFGSIVFNSKVVAKSRSAARGIIACRLSASGVIRSRSGSGSVVLHIKASANGAGVIQPGHSSFGNGSIALPVTIVVQSTQPCRGNIVSTPLIDGFSNSAMRSASIFIENPIAVFGQGRMMHFGRASLFLALSVCVRGKGLSSSTVSRLCSGNIKLSIGATSTSSSSIDSSSDEVLRYLKSRRLL